MAYLNFRTAAPHLINTQDVVKDNGLGNADIDNNFNTINQLKLENNGYDVADLLYAGSDGELTTLSKGSGGQYLVMNQSGTAPEWTDNVISWTGITDKPTEFPPTKASNVTIGGVKADVVGNTTFIDENGVIVANIPSLVEEDVIVKSLYTNSVQEKINYKTNATGTVQHNYTSGTIWYHTLLSSNFTASFTNVPNTANTSTVFVLILDHTGAVKARPVAVQINGTTRTIYWLNGRLPDENPGGYLTVSFTLLNTGTDTSPVWLVFGQGLAHTTV